MQPLCAVYREAHVPVIEQALKAGDFKVDRIFPLVPTRYRDGRRIACGRLSARISFANVNTPDEYERLTARLTARRDRGSPKARPMNDRKPYIEFEHVHKAFGSKVVINDVSFDVMPGETVCILGRSGVGKSVSLQMIMGFLKADSGTCVVAYEDVTNYTEAEMEAHPQESHDGLPERRALRFADRRRKCRVSSARARRAGGRADLPDHRRPARHGRRARIPRPVAVRPVDRHEALGGHCAGAWRRSRKPCSTTNRPPWSIR